MTTEEQYNKAIALCFDVFVKKLQDYGASWRILRGKSVTDQIFIKAKRIRSIEMKKKSMVDEGVLPELIAIVNYGVIGLIQLEKGETDEIDIDSKTALELYAKYIREARELMLAKNHDYDEAWRMMRVESYTDLILMKINRTKEIEDNMGETIISEGIDANYFDMINYAIFGLIKLELEQKEQ